MASSEPEKSAPADAPASAAPAPENPAKDAAADTDADKPADKAAVHARPEREPAAKDYFRIFTYAKRWDYALLVAAILASVGAGTVSRPRLLLKRRRS